MPRILPAFIGCVTLSDDSARRGANRLKPEIVLHI